jgi:hypothetical protein
MLASVPASAQERATFIMTSSERLSGKVVFHGGKHENLIAGNLNLWINDKEETFPFEQVAVIDFIGGTPSNPELAALPASGHLMAMRDGSKRTGQFVNMISGDTVLWKEPDGSERSFMIRDVARIYLNASSARNTFNFSPSAPTATTGVVSGATGNGSVTVKGDAAWTDTGITVRRGQVVRFAVRGEVKYAPGANDIASAAGNPAYKNPQFPVATTGAGGLIGKVGNSAPFAVTASRTVTMPEDGTLMLGINDDNTSDNSGAFYVTVVQGNIR